MNIPNKGGGTAEPRGVRRLSSAIRHWLATILIRTASMLLSDGDRIMSQEGIMEDMIQWRSEKSRLLYRATLRHQRHPFVGVFLCKVDSGGVMREVRVLPTFEEIQGAVSIIVDVHMSELLRCRTQSNLKHLKVYRLECDLHELRDDIAKRVALFDECIQKRDQSLGFLGEMRSLHGHMSHWILLPMVHNADVENRLMIKFESIFDCWKLFEEEKSVEHLNAFHENIKIFKDGVNSLLDEIVPRKKSGTRYDVEAYAVGYVAGYEARLRYEDTTVM